MEKQTDDHVQNSAMGSVKPEPLHPGTGIPMPVSVATPDAEPKAERIAPPLNTGHGIAANTPEGTERNPPYNKLPDRPSSVRTAEEVLKSNAEAKAKEDSNAKSATGGPVDTSGLSSDTPFPRATDATPVQNTEQPK